jgi:hypothetical protein
MVSDTVTHSPKPGQATPSIPLLTPEMLDDAVERIAGVSTGDGILARFALTVREYASIVGLLAVLPIDFEATQCPVCGRTWSAVAHTQLHHPGCLRERACKARGVRP